MSTYKDGKIKCRECKRIKHPVKDDLYFIRFADKTYMCEDCITVAYHQIKVDIANNKRAE